jgi:hypothetical protein
MREDDPSLEVAELRTVTQSAQRSGGLALDHPRLDRQRQTPHGADRPPSPDPPC